MIDWGALKPAMLVFVCVRSLDFRPSNPIQELKLDETNSSPTFQQSLTGFYILMHVQILNELTFSNLIKIFTKVLAL